MSIDSTSEASGVAAEAIALNGVELTASLTVSNLESSLSWYRDTVGFVVDRQHEREGVLVAATIRAGAVRLLLGQDDGAKGADRVRGAGFSLMITIDGDIDAIANGIKERGGVLENDPVDVPWGQRMFRLLDPDGFKLTIATPRRQ